MQFFRDPQANLEPPPSLPARFRLTPEERLLLACSWSPAGRLEAGHADRVAALCRAGVDWPAFLDLVDRHRLQALAYLNVNRHGRTWVPPPVLADLADGAARERTLSLRLGAECLRLVRRFNAAELPVIPLKGALLSWQLYGDPALRQAKDVDLLVREADLRPALALLAGEGYHPAQADCQPLPPEEREAFAAGSDHCHICLWHQGRDILVELHWRLCDWTRTEAPAIWAAHRQETWLGVPVAVLADATLLAYLCEHGAGHAWFRCKWLGDVAMLMAGEPAPDAAARVAAARNLGLGRPLAQAVLLVHWLYDVPLAPALADLVRTEPRSRRLAALALDRLRAPEAATLRQRFGKLAYAVRLRPPSHLWRYLRRLLTQEPAWVFRVLPAWLHVPYRVFRRLAAPRYRT